jgi:dolichol kinase
MIARHFTASSPPNLMLGRKIYHFLMGMVCLGLYAFVLDREGALIVLAWFGLVGVFLDAVRLRIPPLNDFLFRHFRSLLRDKERYTLTGHSYFVIGLVILVYFFDKPIVLLSVLFLAIGDPVASYVGTRWGKTRLSSGKSLEGALGNFVASFVGAMLFLSLYGNQTGYSVPVAGLVGGLVSAISEIIPLPVDDNVAVPVLTAAALTLVRSVF